MKNLLEQHRDKLHKIAEALLQFETLSGKEVEAICEGKPIRVNSEHIQW